MSNNKSDSANSDSDKTIVDAVIQILQSDASDEDKSAAIYQLIK